jgi:uncharacterized protein YecE (DUF72 family)
MTVYVGTSGWVYQDWRGVFYPPDLRQREELAFYARSFGTVEINSTFYGLPAEATIDRWASAVPDDFCFAPKMSQFLTHRKRLRDPADPVERFVDRVRRLGAKLGPVLLQLPPNLPRDDKRLGEVLETIGGRLRVAIEFRHPSWFDDQVFAILRSHEAALCLADRNEELTGPAVATADWGYLRFHWGTGDPPCGYRPETLEQRASQIANLWDVDAEVYAYFNNDPQAMAVRDATSFAAHLCAAGLRPARVPSEAGSTPAS